MKTRTRLPLVALALAALAALAAAPAGARRQDAWAAFSPDDEEFAVLTPSAPLTAAPQQARAAGLKAEGRRYEVAGGDGVTYLVLSLKDTGEAGRRLADGGATPGPQRASAYLDAIAELAWEVLVRPEIDRLSGRRKKEVYPSLSFRRQFELNGKPAREYLLALEKTIGPVYVCADGPRIYVVAAFGPDILSPGHKRFVESFALGRRTPAAPPAETEAAPAAKSGMGVGPGEGGGVGPGRGANTTDGGPVDYSRPFRTSEVTRKAQVMDKPEPAYTAAARKFHVQGTVTVRAVLNASGEVERVVTITGLPHGLTRAAVEAARKIKFVPAVKDGRNVSQWVTIQYNFNIY